jgi:hypothetical protein
LANCWQGALVVTLLTRVSAGVTFGSIARFQAGSITLQSFLPVVQETLALHSFHILNIFK